MSRKLLLNLSNSFKTSKQNKLQIVEINFSKKILHVSHSLLKEGLIRGFFLKDKHTICILLKYVDDVNILKFNSISLVKQRSYCSNEYVKNNFMSSNCSIISTRKGVLSHKEAKYYHLGGFILLNFY